MKRAEDGRSVVREQRSMISEDLELQIRMLQLENQHLRDLLQLAAHDFKDAIEQDENLMIHSRAPSEASSFFLTTPPRSPCTHHRTNRQSSKPDAGPAPLSPKPVEKVCSPDELDDVADVGPPLSPSHNATASNKHVIIDVSESHDRQEALIGSQEVEGDLDLPPQ